MLYFPLPSCHSQQLDGRFSLLFVTSGICSSPKSRKVLDHPLPGRVTSAEIAAADTLANMNDDHRPYFVSNAADVGPVPAPSKPRRRPRKESPQETVRQFWDKFNSPYPGKVFTVLPDNPYARKKAARTPHGTVTAQRAAKSYEEARAECARDVDRIIKESRRTNQKYRDLHFDIEWDLKSGQRNCLDGLGGRAEELKPKGVKRVTVSPAPGCSQDPTG